MAISIGDLQIVLSGGGGNASQAASLGGAISTSKVISQTTTAPNLVTGVTILDAMGNAEGVGTLKWDTTTTSLMWKPFGGTAFNGIGLSPDETKLYVARTFTTRLWQYDLEGPGQLRQGPGHHHTRPRGQPRPRHHQSPHP